MTIKKKFKKKYPTIYFLLKKFKQLINFLFFTLKIITKKIFLIFSIDIKFDTYPLISLKKLLTINFKSLNSNTTYIYNNKIYNNKKVYNLKNLLKKKIFLSKNIINLVDNDKIPLSILECFLFDEKELLLKKKINKKLDNLICYKNHSNKYIYIEGDLGFFHFYLQYIPLMKKQFDSKKYNLLIEKDHFKYYNELLKIFIHKKYKILKEMTFSNCYYLSNENIYPLKKNMLYLREEIRKRFRLNYVRQSPVKRIYIPRTKNNTPGRSIFEETILINYLKKKHNFQLFYPEKYSIKKQIKIFNECEYIIAAHGAALSNLISVNKNTKVIELNGNKDVRWHYAKIFDDIGLSKNYYLLLGKSYNNFFIKFDLKKLKSVLDDLLINN
jgi:hypothetical protein